MANVKITDYIEIDAIADADLIEVVDDVAGIPTSKKSTWIKVKSFLKTYFDTLYDKSPIADTTAIVKGSVDATKLVRIETDGLTTATTRVLTMPDKDIVPMGELADDATPQLGGNLDMNGKGIDFSSTPNITDVKDEDNMVSDSATMLATQQSIKAYVDNTGFQSKMSAYMGSSQSIANLTWTKLEIDTETFDVLGEFDSVTNFRFTPTVAGYYLVIGQIASQNVVADGKTLNVRIYQNGVGIAKSSCIIGAADYAAVGVTVMLYLTTENYLELWFQHNSGAAMSLQANVENTFLQIHRLS